MDLLIGSSRFQVISGLVSPMAATGGQWLVDRWATRWSGTIPLSGSLTMQCEGSGNSLTTKAPDAQPSPWHVYDDRSIGTEDGAAVYRDAVGDNPDDPGALANPGTERRCASRAGSRISA